MKRLTTTVTTTVDEKLEFDCTEGYLLISVWDIFKNDENSEDMVGSGELEFMGDLQRACHITAQLISEHIDRDEFDSVFDYEYSDDTSPGSLARVIYETMRAEQELDGPVLAWLHTSGIKLKAIETPFRAGIGMADDVQ